MANSSPSASPSPQASASPSSASVLGFNIQVPSGSGSSASQYNLGAWRDSMIDPNGFPPGVVQALTKAGINTSQPVKAEDLAHALASIHDVNAVAQIQQMLFYSGFYGPSAKLSDLQLGRFGDLDTAALGKSIIAAGQTSQQLGTYLTVGANTGYAQGKIDQASGVGVTPIKQVSPVDEDYALRTAAHTLLGREPSADDLAGFRAYYDQAYTAGQKAAQQLAAQQTAAGLPDASTLGAAIGRQGVTPWSTANEAPPQTLTSQGESATAAEHDMLTAQGSITGNGTYLPAAVNTGGQYANSSAYANPAYGAFQSQQGQDQALFGQVNGIGTANNTPPTLTDAPSPQAAAEEYLREHEAGAIQTQNAISAYGQILNFIKGNGAIQ